MNIKWNYVFGAVTITVIIGGTIYAIKKARDAEKAEEQAITLEEAMDIVAQAKKNKQEQEEIHIQLPISEVVVHETGPRGPQGIETKPRNKYSLQEDHAYQEELDEDDPLHDAYSDLDEHSEIPYVEPLNEFSYIEEGIDPKEDKTLRYEPSSEEARHQYIRMELAEFEINDPAYRLLLELFQKPFVPTNEGDELLRTQVIDYKTQFFGYTSVWNRQVSYAEMMLHYARSATFNCGESVGYWINYFFNFNEFEWDNPITMDTLLLRLNQHSYFNEERQTFGLFGLTRESMDQAIAIANRNIDRSVTYEIEFNEFLKSCV